MYAQIQSCFLGTTHTKKSGALNVVSCVENLSLQIATGSSKQKQANFRYLNSFTKSADTGSLWVMDIFSFIDGEKIF